MAALKFEEGEGWVRVESARVRLWCSVCRPCCRAMIVRMMFDSLLAVATRGKMILQTLSKPCRKIEQFVLLGPKPATHLHSACHSRTLTPCTESSVLNKGPAKTSKEAC